MWNIGNELILGKSKVSSELGFVLSPGGWLAVEGWEGTWGGGNDVHTIVQRGSCGATEKWMMFDFLLDISTLDSVK